MKRPRSGTTRARVRFRSPSAPKPFCRSAVPLDNPYVTTVPVSLTTADRYARIAASLRAKGRPIPSNDIWIAAHAMQTGADLVSYDQHFDQGDGLAWVRVATSE